MTGSTADVGPFAEHRERLVRVAYQILGTVGDAEDVAHRSKSRVLAAPCTWRGRISGPAMEMEARLLDGDDAVRAGRMIDRKHPIFQRLLVRLGHRLQHYRTLQHELRPAQRRDPQRQS